MNKLFISAFIIFSSVSLSFAIRNGDNMPFFRVSDGDNKILSSDTLRGRVIVGFYESRETSEKNDELKEALNTFKRKNSIGDERITRLAVIDGSPANFGTIWIWKKKLRLKSAEKEITIYGDWDGSMKRDFGFAENESNFFIIDGKGVVRYSRPGKINHNDYGAIENILKDLNK